MQSGLMTGMTCVRDGKSTTSRQLGTNLMQQACHLRDCWTVAGVRNWPLSLHLQSCMLQLTSAGVCLPGQLCAMCAPK